jgi:hypothetical protein
MVQPKQQSVMITTVMITEKTMESITRRKILRDRKARVMPQRMPPKTPLPSATMGENPSLTEFGKDRIDVADNNDSKGGSNKPHKNSGQRNFPVGDVRGGGGSGDMFFPQNGHQFAE